MPTKLVKTHFYADECVPIQVISSLRRDGINILHVFEKDFIRKSDNFHFHQSKKLNRVLITLDNDFNRYNSFHLLNHPGIVLLKVGNVIPKNIERVLRKTLKYLTPDFMRESRVIASVRCLKKEKNQKVTEKFI